MMGVLIVSGSSVRRNCNIQVKSFLLILPRPDPYRFALVDTHGANQHSYRSGGVFQQVKTPKQLQFVSSSLTPPLSYTQLTMI